MVGKKFEIILQSKNEAMLFFSMLGNCFLVKHDLGLEEDWEAGAFFLFRVEVFFSQTIVQTLKLVYT